MSEATTDFFFSIPASIVVASVTLGSEAALISSATERNWTRLGTPMEKRLTSRANKTLSTKHIVPVEYFSKHINIDFTQRLIDLAHTNNWNNFSIIKSLATQIFKEEGILKKENVKKLLDEHPNNYVDISLAGNFDKNDFDLLGGVYQALLIEGDRNQKGIYYTNIDVARKLTSQCPNKKNITFLDPCCGGGIIFKSLKNIDPNNIYGVDCDEIAVFIAKANLIRQFKGCEFTPNIYCVDYLNPSDEQKKLPVFNIKFDAIATNPPWGGISDLGETFDLFFRKASSHLSSNGIISFLLPNSVITVATHKDLRNYILNLGESVKITFFDDYFSGVTTKYVAITSFKKSSNRDIVVYDHFKDGVLGQTTYSTIKNREDLSFTYINNVDTELLVSIEKVGSQTLKGSDWALGVVTGDNKRKLSLEKRPFNEPIYTGKEIHRYTLGKPRHFIIFNRAEMQQAAKDELYRAKEKLIYRFVSSTLCFAYDDTGALTLNSANILIPRVDGCSVKTILALLNSDVLKFYYQKRFGGMKVLKSNLLKLPLPKIDKTTDNQLSSLIDACLQGDSSADQEIQKIVFSLYKLSKTQQKSIKEQLYGKID